MNESSLEDCAALLVNHAMATAQKEFIMDSLPAYCFCGLGDADRIRKWSLCLRHQLEHTFDEGNARQKSIQRVLMKSLETALQQHLSICFQMKDDDDLVYDYFGSPGASHSAHHIEQRQEIEKRSETEFPPISVNLEVPDFLVRQSQMNYNFSEPVLNEEGTQWNTKIQLQFIPPSGRTVAVGQEDKAVQVDEFNLGLLPTVASPNKRVTWTSTLPPRVSHMMRQRQSLLAALDMRRKQKKLKLILPEGYGFTDEPDEVESPDFDRLERLEIEVWENLKTLSPLQRQSSFYNYMKILNDSLENYKKELEKWDRIAQNHFEMVKTVMSKDKLEEVARYRLLRQDIRREITFLEDQIQHRALVIEKDSSGEEKTKPLVDKYTSRERFARSTREINEMITMLKEQIQSQINQHSSINGTNLSMRPDDYVHLV